MSDINYKEGLNVSKLSDTEIVMGNEIIARSQFSGMEEFRSRSFRVVAGNYTHHRIQHLIFLKFHEHPSWQLFVVEEIEKLDFGFKMCRKRVEIYRDSTKEIIYTTKKSSRTESLFDALVYFCKWHKTQNK